ncbi:MAG TPA: hypothetical protein VM307_14165 [Egibacteraceae bacterium]|nr:hypothetical protein [Egibacteraceae bacterium]
MQRKTTSSSARARLAAAYDDHAPSVFGLALRVTGDRAVAGELTAQVFAALRPDLLADTGGHLRACLVTEVHRHAVAWRRDHGTADPSASGGDHTPAALVDRAYYAGESYDRIAHRLGMEPLHVAELLRGWLHAAGGRYAADGAGGTG